MTSEPLLITGGSGTIGWYLCRHFAGKGTPVIGTYDRNRLQELPGLQLPLEEPERLAAILANRTCSALIHTAAMTAPDLCEREPERTHRVNVQATRRLLEWLPSETPFIYFSTDLVFDGKRGLYREEDRANPVNRYGESKLLAESLVLKRPNSIILRIAKVISPGSPSHPDFIDWMRERFEAGQELPLFSDQFRSHLWVGDIAAAVEAILAQGIQAPLYHLGGPARQSRLDLGRAYARAAGFTEKLIRPIRMQDAGLVVRGADCSLNSQRIARDYGLRTTPVEEAMEMLVGR